MRILGILFIFLFIYGCSSSSEKSDEQIIKIDTPRLYFDANGGSFEDGTTVKISQLISFGETPVRENFMFSHWNSEIDGSGDSMTYLNSSSYASTEGEDDVTMYAKWTPTDGDFNVVFEAKIPLDLRILRNLPSGSVITLPDNNDYTIPDYTLSGWVDLKTSVLYTGTYTVEKTVTLFAVWKRVVLPEECVLVLMAKGERIYGDGEACEIGIDMPCKILRTDCGLVALPAAFKSGFFFKGWWLSEAHMNGGFFYPYPGHYLFDDHTTLSAVWE
jgi:hypothetical protein